MDKLVIIGIDSMDIELVNKYIDYLPNFKKIIDQSPKIKLESVFPPDSDTAWSTIYTGLNPAKHGFFKFVDPLEKTSIDLIEYFDSSKLNGNTFWDIASNFGKKVCIIYPHAIYPIWPTNGFIISTSSKTSEYQIYPENFKFQFELEPFEVPKRIPYSKSEYDEYLNRLRSIVKKQFHFCNNMYATFDCDLFFFYSSALDFVQHIFWNYCDEQDPTYPGDSNPFRNSIRDFYVLHDELIGELINNIDKNTSILILSDHGHTMRPIKLFNINKVLKDEGYLFPKCSITSPITKTIENFKRIAANTAQKTNLRTLALQILRRYPSIKQLYTVPSSIDFNETIAHCTDLSGLKAYSYGGIIIKADKIDNGADYFRIRDDIIKKLNRYTDPLSNNPIFEWIVTREELYNGKYLVKYPDILFKLRDEYGAGWSIDEGLFSKAYSHNFYPGSHRGDTPVFFLLNLGKRQCNRDVATLMDIAPTILDILDINGDFDFDGNSIYQ